MNDITITNPEKVLYPQDKITKLDVINYYIDISSLMLPYIKNRLLSVIRCHTGINDCFYKKHPTTDKNMVKIKKFDNEEYFYIDSMLELVYQAQMGSLEFHIGGSIINKINQPNLMVFDLDPDENLSINALRSAVVKLKSILDNLGLISFLKTSGGKGYHIVIPFKKSSSWNKFYKFSEHVANIAENTWPDIFTTNIRKNQRHNKIFIDYLRNNKNSTCIAPYSLRSRIGAPISMPIKWEELNKIRPNQITIKNYKKFLNNSWDHFFDTEQKIL